VTPEDKLAPITGALQKREHIAARYSPLQTTLYGISEAVAEELEALPVFLCASEAIGLIAYGRATALASPVPGAPPIFERWQTHVTGASPHERQYPLVHRMRLALARVYWWKQRKRTGTGPAECPIRPLRPADRAEVRWAIRKHDTTAIKTVALLRSDVRQLLAAQSARKDAVDRTVRIICAEIAAEHLIALGRPGSWRNKTVAGKHERIPSEFFANPHVTIRTDGWATCNPEAPRRELAEWAGPDWGDVRFRRDEVLQLFRDHLAFAAPPQTTTETILRQAEAPTLLPRWRPVLARTGAEIAAQELDEHPASTATARQKLAIPNKPGGGGKKIAAATEAMVHAVQAGCVTLDRLRRMRQKELVGLYPNARRTTLARAREAALAMLGPARHSDKFRT
jgi:hypothetical protein